MIKKLVRLIALPFVTGLVLLGSSVMFFLIWLYGDEHDVEWQKKDFKKDLNNLKKMALLRDL